MLIFIYGQNSYLSLKKLETMRTKFFAQIDLSKMNFVQFPAPGKSKFDLGEIIQAIKSPPFLSAKRMVVIKGLLAEFSKKEDAKDWIENLDHIPESSIVILFEDLSVKKTEAHSLFKAFKGLENTYTYPFDILSESELDKWAQDYLKNTQLKINKNLLNKVLKMVGADLWQLAGELDKLTAFAAGADVTDEMIDVLVRTNSQEKIFELMDAASLGNRALAMQYLENERNFGNSDNYLFAMLARQVRLILSARDVMDRNKGATSRDIATELDVHPFVAQKTMAQARNFDLQSLKKLQNLLYELDLKLKRSLVSDRVAVDRVIFEMIGVS